MKLLNKLIELFYPWTNNAEDFILKNEATWYSNKYRYILYSGNKGKTFKRILEASPPLFTHNECILEYNWSYDYKTFCAENESFSKYKNQFKSLKDIQEYHNEEYTIFLKGRASIAKQRKEYLELINNNIK